MKKQHLHETTPEIQGTDQVKAIEAVDAAVKFARNSRATWDELLVQAPNGDCRKKQSCAPVEGH